jgi:ABC-type multidrug transport system fused ATPase/permease subunit
VIVVAHRLSTIRNSDQVIYIENGQVIASGTFEEVKAKSTSFQEQAEFMGL